MFNKIFDVFGSKEEKKKEEVPAYSSSYADVTILLDRSSSMSSMKEAVVEGFNEYVTQMRKNPGVNKWSLVQFDEENSAKGANEEFPYVTYSQCNEKEVPSFCIAPSSVMHVRSLSGVLYTGNPSTPAASGFIYFTPRGSTALVDAMYKTVESIESRVSGQSHIKPVVMVITDGEENSSFRHTSSELRELIARTQAKGFEYIYLGANQDSFAEARKYGISTDMSKYCNTPVLSGGIDISSASCTNNFAPTNAGLRSAIVSGFVGCFAISSGSATC